MKGDKLYLIHILESIQQIESYTSGGREAFVQSRMVQDAVLRNFEVMGEATKRLWHVPCGKDCTVRGLKSNHEDTKNTKHSW